MRLGNKEKKKITHIKASTFAGISVLNKPFTTEDSLKEGSLKQIMSKSHYSVKYLEKVSFEVWTNREAVKNQCSAGDDRKGWRG